jgi:hypothetical protein
MQGKNLERMDLMLGSILAKDMFDAGKKYLEKKNGFVAGTDEIKNIREVFRRTVAVTKKDAKSIEIEKRTGRLFFAFLCKGLVNLRTFQPWQDDQH